MIGAVAYSNRKGENMEKEKVFRDYAEVKEKLIEGFTVVKVYKGINASDSGIMLELERQIDNVTIGVDMIYDPACEEGEPSFVVSNEYVKNICQ